ncbi:MAG: L-seryl-tRNA(Sec) selenium transferase [Solirubrobacteraceae bacterium]
MDSARLRTLPSVDQLAAGLAAPHALAVAAARAAIAERRAEIVAGADPDEDLLDRARARLESLRTPSLRRVINATGVIVHTNLGRAPLAAAARAAVARAAAGYSNLELDLEPGVRGSRRVHVEALLRGLTGAEAAVVVNNGAAAVLLAAAALGGPGAAIVVSRGQLVEIGGGFRIPEVIAQSGSRLVEVGTTNRTRLEDYRRGLEAPDAAAVMRVHPSNFRTAGFVCEVAIEELCGLGAPVIDDVGSGALAEVEDEPTLRRSVAAGAALVCCSGDKLLGGPQSGVLVGRAEAVARAAAHPLARALRIDKLSLAALEATLRLHRDGEAAAIPVLAMLRASAEELAGRAERLRAGLEAVGVPARVGRASARVGGGALALLELSGPVLELDPVLVGPLRRGSPPVLGRVSDGRLLLDPRTIAAEEVDEVVAAVAAAASSRL